MKTNGYLKRKREAGFSMVEVLVASTILIVIVMLLSMLFQQTSLAWRTGVKRADGFIGIRAALGAIQRDASAMIDIRNVPVDLRNGNQEFSSSSLKFYTLNTAIFLDDKTKSMPLRALRYITYSKGMRSEYALDANNTWQQIGSVSDVTKVAERTGNKNSAVPVIDAFEFKNGPNASEIPLYLTIDAHVTTVGYSLDIGAASAGPDKVWDTKDDIRTWKQ